MKGERPTSNVQRPTPNEEASAAKRPSLADQVAGMDAEQRYEKVKGMLASRGVTMSHLAELATKRAKNWPHVTAVLRRLRKGEHTWPRLADFLTRDELIVLDRLDLAKVEVPRGTFGESDS